MGITHLVRDNIQKLQAYSSARSEFKGQADVFLDANENPFETGLNRYPDPLQWKLKAEISTIKEIDEQHIFLGNGSDEVIDLLIRIFCEPKEDHIIILPPTYGMYKVSAGIANGALKTISLLPNYQPDVDRILAETNAHSKLLFLCSPNNPTGNSFDPPSIEKLVQHFPGIVVIDEAYIDFSSQESFIKKLDTYPNLLVMQTFSKAWGLAGIRLGMAFASKEIIALLNKVKPPYNVNQLTQTAALEAIQNKAQKEEMVKTLLRERSRLEEILPNFAFVQKVHPSDANFILIQVNDALGLYNYLIKEKIIVRNRSNVHLCEGGIRISVGRPKENDRLLAALKVYV